MGTIFVWDIVYRKKFSTYPSQVSNRANWWLWSPSLEGYQEQFPGVMPGHLMTLRQQPWRLSGAISQGSRKDIWWLWCCSLKGYQEQFPEGQARPSGDFYVAALKVISSHQALFFITVRPSCRITIYAPMIYTAPCIMFWMHAYPLREEVGGGWALEFSSFLGLVKWERANRQVPFGVS
jgi:hypothetical protein